MRVVLRSLGLLAAGILTSLSAQSAPLPPGHAPNGAPPAGHPPVGLPPSVSTPAPQGGDAVSQLKRAVDQLRRKELTAEERRAAARQLRRLQELLDAEAAGADEGKVGELFERMDRPRDEEAARKAHGDMLEAYKVRVGEPGDGGEMQWRAAEERARKVGDEQAARQWRAHADALRAHAEATPQWEEHSEALRAHLEAAREQAEEAREGQHEAMRALEHAHEAQRAAEEHAMRHDEAMRAMERLPRTAEEPPTPSAPAPRARTPRAPRRVAAAVAPEPVDIAVEVTPAPVDVRVDVAELPAPPTPRSPLAPTRRRVPTPADSGDDAEVRGMIEELRAQMSEVRELIEAIKQQRGGRGRQSKADLAPGGGGATWPAGSEAVGPAVGGTAVSAPALGGTMSVAGQDLGGATIAAPAPGIGISVPVVAPPGTAVPGVSGLAAPVTAPVGPSGATAVSGAPATVQGIGR